MLQVICIFRLFFRHAFWAFRLKPRKYKKRLNNYTQEVGTGGLATTVVIIAYVATSAAWVRTYKTKE